MADDSFSIGSFIPNKAGNPHVLSLTPAERAQAANEKDAGENTQQANHDSTQRVVDERPVEATSESNSDSNVDIDV